MEVNWIVMLNDFVTSLVSGVGLSIGIISVVLCFNLLLKGKKALEAKGE